jgi:glycosyltransferase involved in cell wall biosynthesis
LTSLTESFPLVLLESAREKTPVITTDVGGVRDMIPDDSYSIVLDDSEVKTIVTALKKLFQLKKDNKLKEMGTKLYEFTSKRFSIHSFEQSIYRMYKLSKK